MKLYGGTDEIGEGDKEAQISICKISKSQGVKYSIGNIANNLITSLYGDRW